MDILNILNDKAIKAIEKKNILSKLLMKVSRHLLCGLLWHENLVSTNFIGAIILFKHLVCCKNVIMLKL